METTIPSKKQDTTLSAEGKADARLAATVSVYGAQVVSTHFPTLDYFPPSPRREVKDHVALLIRSELVAVMVGPPRRSLDEVRADRPLIGQVLRVAGKYVDGKREEYLKQLRALVATPNRTERKRLSGSAREKLIIVALDRLSKRGVQAPTLAAIAEASGLTRAQVSHSDVWTKYGNRQRGRPRKVGGSERVEEEADEGAMDDDDRSIREYRAQRMRKRPPRRE